jgi:hypothetical protein
VIGNVIGFFGFLLMTMLSRMLAERAFRQLSSDQKVTLLDAFSTIRSYSIAPVIFIVLVMVGVPFALPEYRLWGLLAGIVLLVVYMIFMHFLVTGRMRSLGLPPEYVRQFLTARYVSYAGILVLALGVMAGIWL